jgi:hypothetical protein
MESTDARLARLRADIAAGTYAPPTDAVAEALVGWIARPEQFERVGRTADRDGDTGHGDHGDQEGRS